MKGIQLTLNYHPKHQHEKGPDDPPFRWRSDIQQMDWSEEKTRMIKFVMQFEAFVERFCTLEEQRHMIDENMNLEQAQEFVARLAEEPARFNIEQHVNDFDGTGLQRWEDRHVG